jgi:hypothetical protein
MSLYFKIREAVRMNPLVAKTLYLGQSSYFSYFGRLSKVTAERPSEDHMCKVAICLRFRDEARFLAEWIDYYIAAGVSHFFLYNNNSEDDYLVILRPFLESGAVTLIDWRQTPASPAADEDCIRRAIGRYEWVGFFDADEFVVIRDGSSIPQFLSQYSEFPAVALHWRFYGSNGHKDRPSGPVIGAYTRRQQHTDVHVKCFVRPSYVTQNRNPHSWYFRDLRCAVNERKRPVFGSLSNPSADHAWINHYYYKSCQDYLEKAARPNGADLVGMRFPSRTIDRLAQAMLEGNEVEDDCAVSYYQRRRQAAHAHLKP